MTTGRGRASGKLILAGEHAVVHGHPAVAFAVDLGSEVTLTPHQGPTVVDAPVVDARLQAAIEQVVGPTGWRVGLSSTLPIGRGMGSSASIGVALVRAWRDAQGLGDGSCFDEALAFEQHFHGTPSGVDVAVSDRGGVLRFRKGPPPEFVSLPAPDWTAVVIDSGAKGDTGELVAGVAARRPGIDHHLERIGALVDAVVEVLDLPAALGPLLTENHRLLGAIGVSTPVLDALVQLAIDAGAYGAKLSGAGGGGVVLALVDDPDPVLEAARAQGYDAWAVRPAGPQEAP